MGRATLGALAFAVGALGEVLLVAGQHELGTLLLFAAVALGVLAWSRPLSGPEALTPAAAVQSHARMRVGVALSALLTVGALVAWFVHPAATFGVQGWLWLAAMAALVIACVPGRGERRSTTGPPWTRLEVGLFLGLVALALFTYLTRLDDIPWRFHYDEAIAYQEAMRFYRGPHISVFTTTWYGTSLPSLWFALSAALMHLVGTGLGGVRFGVALLGALTIVPLYGLGRLLGGRIVAVLAAFAWATTPVAIHYSRVSIINSTTAFFWAGCFFFLLRGLRSRAPLDFALCGLLAGLSMYTYYGTRLLPIVLLVFGLYLRLAHRDLFRAMARHLALVPIGFFVGFGPLLAYFMENPTMWSRRGVSMATPPDQLWSVARLNFLGLSAVDSNDHVYWAPFLQPAQALLVLLGAGVLLWRWRDPAAFLTVLWGSSVLLVGGTLIDPGHAPDFAHWTPAFPAFFLALAVPPVAWLRSLAGDGTRRFAYALVGAGVVAIAGVNAYLYLVAYPRDVPPSFEAAQGRFLARLTSNDRVWFVGNSWQSYFSVIGEVMAPDVEAGDLLNPSRSLPVLSGKKELVFVFNDDELKYLPLVESYYPAGQEGRLETPGGAIAHTYRVSADRARGRHGVRLALADGRGRTVWTGRVSKIGAFPPGVQPGRKLTATWSGFLFLANKHPTLTMGNGRGLRLWIDGTPARRAAPVHGAGWVSFTVRAAPAAKGPVRLRLGGAEIPRQRLWPAQPDAGLAVTVRTASGSFHRIDQFVGASLLSARSPLVARRDPDFVPIAAPGSRVELVRWEGRVRASADGRYGMQLRTDAHARLYVDGRLVIDLCHNRPPSNALYLPGGRLWVPGGYQPVAGSTTLRRGWHDVRLDLQPTHGISGLEWSWTRPDRVTEIVPPAVLRHARQPSQPAPTALPCEPVGQTAK